MVALANTQGLKSYYMAVIKLSFSAFMVDDLTTELLTTLVEIGAGNMSDGYTAKMQGLWCKRIKICNYLFRVQYKQSVG